jgi:prepilin peptidase CpaA
LSYLPPVIQAILVVLAVLGAFFDARQRRVPNWLTLAGLVLGVALNTFLFETPGLWMSLKGLGLAMLVYFPLYLLRGMGAGDVKLMMAIGALAGPANWFGILVLTSLFGAIAALGMIAFKSRFRQTMWNIWMILTSIRLRQTPYETNPDLDIGSERSLRLPHAITIGLGTLAFLAAAAIWAPR